MIFQLMYNSYFKSLFCIAVLTDMFYFVSSFQIFQESDRSTNDKEKHEVLVISHIAKLKQSHITLKQSIDEKDIKIQ